MPGHLETGGRLLCCLGIGQLAQVQQGVAVSTAKLGCLTVGDQACVALGPWYLRRQHTSKRSYMFLEDMKTSTCLQASQAAGLSGSECMGVAR